MKGHIRKQGDTWRFVVELERDHATGKRRQKWVSGFATKREAEKELRKRLRLIDEGEDAFPARLLVRDYIDGRWLPHLETQGRIRPGTLRGYRQVLRDHILPVFGGMEVRKVRPAHVQEALDRMTRTGLAPRTVAHARAAVSAAFTQAVRWQLVATNAARATQAPAKRAPKLRVPTADELRQIITEAEGTRWELPILLAATTGARRGEVLGLRWGNVDLDRGRAHIVESLQRVGGIVRYVEPKTERSVREVPLLPEVVERLRAHRVEQAERLLKIGVRVTDTDAHPVCDRGDGAPLDPGTFTHAASRIARDAGLDGVRLHDLRHAVATVLAAGGNRPELTSKLLGHASVAFTLQTYTHPTDDEMGAVGEAIGRALSG